MIWQLVPYAIPLALAAGVSVLVAVYAWRRRPAAGAAPLALFMLAAAEWCLGYALELGSSELAAKVFWARAQYLGIVAVAGLMLIIVLQYTGYEKWLTRRNLVLLAIVPIVVLLLVWTNDAHHLVWTEIQLVPYGSFSILELGHGPGFWLIIAFSYLCLLAGTVLLFQAFRRSPPVYRAQVGVMFAGTLAPWIGNLLYVSGLNPFPHLDLTPFAFTITGLAATWGLFRFQFLDVVPIARDAVIEGMTDGVIVLDRQSRIVDINPTGEEMLEIGLDDVIGTPVEQALSAWSELVARYRDVHETHEEIEIGQDASRRWLDLRLSPLYNRNGRWTGRLVVLRDITERKHVEQERERLINELDAFAHTVAHDLKNPLTAVIGSVHLLRDYHSSLSGQARQEYIGMLQRGVTKMRDIVDSLLLLASVRKRPQVFIEPVDMGWVVNEVLERLDYMVQEYGAEIVLPDTWQTALGYGPWIEEVWANYISNALKYGGTPPRLELGSSSSSNGMVRFWIRDNGPGLTPEEQTRLFVPFTRLDQVVTAGHGLGLSIVQRIIERLEGQVGVESTVGVGSVFSFALPAIPAEAQ
jgi:PAS domain S-box-containing protein